MKEFTAPDITMLDFSLTAEPTNGGSGVNFVPSVPIVPMSPLGDWKITTEWCNHNTGSHSELKIKGHNYGKDSGDSIKMVFSVGGFKLDTVTPGDDILVLSDKSVNGFTLTRNNHFNSNENFEFVIQLTCSETPYNTNIHTGAVGTTGVPCPAFVACTSYVAS